MCDDCWWDRWPSLNTNDQPSRLNSMKITLCKYFATRLEQNLKKKLKLGNKSIKQIKYRKRNPFLTIMIELWIYSNLK